MNQSNIQIIAARVRGLAKGLLALADQLDAQAPHLAVQLPPRDLFSDMFGETPLEDLDNLTVIPKDETPEEIPAKAQRIYQRVGCRMRDEAIRAAQKIGRAQGYCQRSDIERSLRRENPECSREEIREAVNAAVAELGLTCIVYNSYRYYRRSDRKRIMDSAINKLRA